MSAPGIVYADPRKKVKSAVWRKYENVGLESGDDLDRIVLNWVDRKTSDLNATGALVALAMEATIEAAPTITMTLRDPTGRLFAKRQRRVRSQRYLDRKRRGPNPVDQGWESILPPDLRGTALDVKLDGVTFRLVKVRYTHATQEAELTFEHRLVYWLKRKYGPKRASRSKATRAMFILALLREVRAREYRFVCPDLTVKQPIDKQKSDKTSALTASRRRRPGFLQLRAKDDEKKKKSDDPDAEEGGIGRGAKLTVQGQTATYQQKRNGQIVLDTCASVGAEAKATKAAMCAVIVESWVKNLEGGDRDSRGVLQVRDQTAQGLGIDNRNIEECVETFLRKGFWGKGGAMEIARKNPSMSVGHVAQNTQGSAFPDRYDQVADEAQEWIDAYGSGGGADSVRGSYSKSYQYSRNNGEHSWASMQRLASEVGWRCFVVGNSLYYMSEEALFARRPRYQINAEDPHATVLDLSYDMDWGKPVAECSLIVAIDRWGAPPGSVVLLDGFGPADGRWMVSSLRRDWFQPTAEVTLRQPIDAKKEPAAERVDRANSAGESGASPEDDGTKTGRLYAAARDISDAGGPYVYGGGHGPKLSSLDPKKGLDCSSSSALALSRAGMYDGDVAQVSGWFASSWGEAGEGDRATVWANSGHVWIELKGLGNGKRFDTSPYGSGGRGPRLRTTDRPTGGFTPRHWPGT